MNFVLTELEIQPPRSVMPIAAPLCLWADQRRAALTSSDALFGRNLSQPLAQPLGPWR